MEERLNEAIDEEKRDQLIRWINELYDNGVLKIRDWMSIYDILVNACEREAAIAYENLMTESINESTEEGGADA